VLKVLEGFCDDKPIGFEHGFELFKYQVIPFFKKGWIILVYHEIN